MQTGKARGQQAHSKKQTEKAGHPSARRHQHVSIVSSSTSSSSSARHHQPSIRPTPHNPRVIIRLCVVCVRVGGKSRKSAAAAVVACASFCILYTSRISYKQIAQSSRSRFRFRFRHCRAIHPRRSPARRAALRLAARSPQAAATHSRPPESCCCPVSVLCVCVCFPVLSVPFCFMFSVAVAMH